MKKLTAVLLVLVLMVAAFSALAEEAVISHEDYMAADIDTEVIIETTVQDTQSWWDGKITAYCQSPDGAYFIYNMECSEEDAVKLPMSVIRVKGYKSEWAGEIEITDATFEFVEGAEPFIPEQLDVTELVGTDDLILHQNELVSYKGMTVVPYDESGAAFAYKNPDEKTDDLYFKASIGDLVCEFCVEFYLTGKDSEVYKAVEALNVGDVIDIVAYLYWYEGANPHVINIAAAE